MYSEDFQLGSLCFMVQWNFHCHFFGHEHTGLNATHSGIETLGAIYDNVYIFIYTCTVQVSSFQGYKSLSNFCQCFGSSTMNPRCHALKVRGGKLKARKGVNVPTVQIDCAALTEKDIEVR